VLAIAEALIARDHHVVVLNQPSVRDRAEMIGCTFVAFAELPDYAPHVAIEEQIDVALRALTAKVVGDDVRMAAEQHGADCIVVDANLVGALAAAETLETPSAVLLHSLCASYTKTWFADLWPFVASAVNATRASFGLESVDDWPGAFARHDMQVVAVPRTFEGPVPSSFTRPRHFGFLVPGTELVTTHADFPPGEDPTVLVGLSTTYQAQDALLARIVDALGGLAVRALVTTAGQVDTDVLPQPHNVTIVERAPHRTLLEHTDVMVTHGGLGSVAHALSAGVPLVCAPLGRDQHLNAARVSTLGAGITVDATARAPEIAAAVEAVLAAPAYRDGAARLRDASEAAGGAGAAAAALEALVRRPLRRPGPGP
jgi:MGT family glycosyltransferase